MDESSLGPHHNLMFTKTPLALRGAAPLCSGNVHGVLLDCVDQLRKVLVLAALQSQKMPITTVF